MRIDPKQNASKSISTSVRCERYHPLSTLVSPASPLTIWMSSGWLFIGALRSALPAPLHKLLLECCAKVNFHVERFSSNTQQCLECLPHASEQVQSDTKYFFTPTIF